MLWPEGSGAREVDIGGGRCVDAEVRDPMISHASSDGSGIWHTNDVLSAVSLPHGPITFRGTKTLSAMTPARVSSVATPPLVDSSIAEASSLPIAHLGPHPFLTAVSTE